MKKFPRIKWLIKYIYRKIKGKYDRSGLKETKIGDWNKLYENIGTYSLVLREIWKLTKKLGRRNEE